FLQSARPHRHPHPFPTRRSSDLKFASAALCGSRTLASSQESGMPSPSLSREVAWGPGVGGAPTQLVGSLPKPVSETRWREKPVPDRKSTRLNSSHVSISYAVFCL